MKRDYQTLDAIVVCAVLLIVGGSVLGYMLLDIPQANLPTLSGLIQGLVGVVIGGYAGFRWGASQTDKTHSQAPGSASVSIEATTGPLKPDEAPKGSEQ